MLLAPGFAGALCYAHEKSAGSIKKIEGSKILNNYLTWDVAVNDGETILQAIEIEENYHISFWDAMIVSAAYLKNAAIILIEDLNEGQQIEGIAIVNPFK